MNDFDISKLNAADPSSFSTLENELEQVLLTESLAYAEEYLNFLNSLLEQKGSEIEAKQPALYDQLQTYWVKLAFLAYIFLETGDQGNIMKTRLLFSIQHGYDPNQLLKITFNLYDSDEFVKGLFQDFAKNLEQNTEQFGTQPVEIEGRKMLPTLKYWIQDYSKFPSKVSKRGSVERLNYINQSVNTRSLTQVYRQQLLKILKFYDDLLNAERPIVQINHNQSRSMPARTSQLVPTMDFAPPAIRPVGSPVNIQQKLDDLKNRVK